MGDKYRDWELLDNLPEGWKLDHTVGSPVCGYSFATNGKSPLRGQKRVLVFVGKIETKSLFATDPNFLREKSPPPKRIIVIDGAYRKTLNDLARKRLEYRLLADIRCDLMVCELEGWDKKEYIKELVSLIRGMLKSDKKQKSDPAQSHFDM